MFISSSFGDVGDQEKKRNMLNVIFSLTCLTESSGKRNAIVNYTGLRQLHCEES